MQLDDGGPAWPLMVCIPSDVMVNKMQQTTIHDQPVQHCRILANITSKAPTTQVEEDTDGMLCIHEAKCLLSGEPLRLMQSGTIEGISDFFRLRQNDSLNAICSRDTTMGEEHKTFLVQCFNVLETEEKDTYINIFKFEDEQVKNYVKKKAVDSQARPSETPAVKKKIDMGSPGWAQEWPSAKRRRIKPDDRNSIAAHLEFGAEEEIKVEKMMSKAGVQSGEGNVMMSLS